MINIEEYLIVNFPHVPITTSNIIIESAKEDIMNYCNLDEVPVKLENTLLQMVIHKINTMNEVGISNVNGVVTMVYDHNYPAHIYKNLKRFRKLA